SCGGAKRSLTAFPTRRSSDLELVRGLRAPVVQGELLSSEAYAQALRGSGLEMTVGSSGTVTVRQAPAAAGDAVLPAVSVTTQAEDRKSTRLNSSHVKISYAVV